MAIQMLATDGGSHPPEMLALATARAIFDINPQIEKGRLIQATAIQNAIAAELMEHHSKVQDREKDHLEKRSHERHSINYLSDRDEALAEAEAALKAIDELLKGSPWADRYNDRVPGQDEAGKDMLSPRRVALNEIASHFMTAKDIERSWHRDRNNITKNGV